MYTVSRNNSNYKHTTVCSIWVASVVNLYIRGEGGDVWTGIGYGSQVDDVAVQDLLISDGNGKWSKTKRKEQRKCLCCDGSAVPTTTHRSITYINQYLLNTFRRSSFLHVFSDASD